jgi:hypothetical protein
METRGEEPRSPALEAMDGSSTATAGDEAGQRHVAASGAPSGRNKRAGVQNGYEVTGR